MKPNKLSPSVCVRRQHPHNARIRWSDHFECEDCGALVWASDERWFFTNKFGNRQERNIDGRELQSLPEGL